MTGTCNCHNRLCTHARGRCAAAIAALTSEVTHCWFGVLCKLVIVTEHLGSCHLLRVHVPAWHQAWQTNRQRVQAGLQRSHLSEARTTTLDTCQTHLVSYSGGINKAGRGAPAPRYLRAHHSPPARPAAIHDCLRSLCSPVTQDCLRLQNSHNSTHMVQGPSCLRGGDMIPDSSKNKIRCPAANSRLAGIVRTGLCCCDSERKTQT